MRLLTERIESKFDDLDRRTRIVLGRVPAGSLFWSPLTTNTTLTSFSAGGSILRSGAMVEQAFLGITRRLWDDPFEWTLPEKLNNAESISLYLDEVREQRVNGFAFLRDDSELLKQIPAPEQLRPIIDVLITAIVSAERQLAIADALATIKAAK